VVDPGRDGVIIDHLNGHFALIPDQLANDFTCNSRASQPRNEYILHRAGLEFLDGFFADFDDVTIGNAVNGDIFIARLTDIVGISEESGPTLPTRCGDFIAHQQVMRLTCGLRGHWQVIDLAGRIVSNGFSQTADIPLQGLPQGYFLFTVTDGQQRVVVPFIVP